VSPELSKPDVNTVCGGVLDFSHSTEKVECMWYIVTVVDKWFGGSVSVQYSESTSESSEKGRLSTIEPPIKFVLTVDHCLREPVREM